MSKKRTSYENFALLIQSYEQMSKTKPFEIKSFIRQIQPFCKTSRIKGKFLFFRVRGANVGLMIEIKKDCFIVTKSYEFFEFTFYCDTAKFPAKQLLYKMFRHNLISSRCKQF